jgi:hypothetical protein
MAGLKGRQVFAILGLAVCSTLAGVQGFRTTHDLDWPGDPDLSRDISIAETIRSGHPLSDPVYRGEWAWYNPLVPGIVAAVSAVLNRPTHLVYARFGAYANLLVPLSFFALLWNFFDPLVALAGTTAFLFLGPQNEPAWTSATYSPWLLPVHFVQSLFYLALLLIARAWSDPIRSNFIMLGALLGLVLLGHTAPALILLVVVTAGAVRDLVAAPAHARTAVATGSVLLLATAALVSAPLLVSVVGHYRLAIQNQGPPSWVYEEVALSNLSTFLNPSAMLSLRKVIECIGVVYLFRSRRKLPAQTLLVTAATTAGFFAYSYLVQYARNSRLTIPALVPGFHFLFYLRALEAMAFGIGLVWLGRLLAGVISRVMPAWRPALVESTVLAVVFAALSVAVATVYGSYRSRSDFIAERANAREMFSTQDLRAMYSWIATSTSRSDVFIAPHNVGLSVIATAGRKVVALDAAFSNPFVNWEQRAHDQEKMLQSLNEGDWAAFSIVATRYRVRYIATSVPLFAEPMLRCCLQRAWTSGQWIIYKVT